MDREHLYQAGDVIETRGGRQFEVLSVGEETYFLRRLDWHEGDAEPEERSWGITGCEDKTWLVRERGATGYGPSSLL